MRFRRYAPACGSLLVCALLADGLMARWEPRFPTQVSTIRNPIREPHHDFPACALVTWLTCAAWELQPRGYVDCGFAKEWPWSSAEFARVMDCERNAFSRQAPFVAVIGEPSTDSVIDKLIIGKPDGSLTLLLQDSLGPGLLRADCRGVLAAQGQGVLCEHSVPWLLEGSKERHGRVPSLNP